MITLLTKQLHKVQAAHGLSKKELAVSKKILQKHIAGALARDQHFHNIVDDTETVRIIEQYAASVKGSYDHVVLCGIGGSALGPICLKEALTHLYAAEQKERNHPILHVIDNVDPAMIAEVESILNFKRTLFLFISKSGNTAEVLSMYLYFKARCIKEGVPFSDHALMVTHAGKGKLYELGTKDELPIIEHGPVGGRFAVLSSVGLLPAALLGINIKKLLKGAKQMRDKFLSIDPKQNLPFQMANMQYLLTKKGKHIHVMMPYSQKLFRFADWYRQLLAESIGKEVNDKGKKVNIGITPVKALGTTDQHSQSQLYNEGPNNKFIMLVHAKSLHKTIRIPSLYKGDKSLAYLQGATFNQLIDAEREGTADSYTAYNKPNITIQIDKVDEVHLGGLFMLFEGATAFLGELFGINAYNQPGVELAKKRTVTYLKKKR
ncbi:MAG: glucose-6-phosphate isomerase [Candidatus Magasanikbacteria bacterium]|jgi:glucose-6-phosphate isomerase|nr:glucose-6-phosphate isomerase [Candidatus Magasanikbacteria bacterium]